MQRPSLWAALLSFIGPTTEKLEHVPELCTPFHWYSVHFLNVVTLQLRERKWQKMRCRAREGV